MSAARVLAVVGLKREAKLIAGPSVRSVASGGDPTALERRLEQALQSEPAVAVISVGLAGALSPKLRLGDWVVADRIVSAGGGWATDARWQFAIAGQGRLGTVRVGPLAGSDAMVLTAEAKLALHTGTGALATDMESHVAAEVAARCGLPFAALRIISDTADRNLPRAVLAGMTPDGGMNLIGVLKALAADPRQLPSLIRTGKEAELAFRRLALLGGEDGGLLGPGIGCPYLG